MLSSVEALHHMSDTNHANHVSHANGHSIPPDLAGRIVFIVPHQELFEIATRVVDSMGITDRVAVVVGLMESGVEVAKRAESEGADLLIARGGTAELIQEAGIALPLIELQFSVYDITSILLAARQAAGVPDPRIALLGARNQTGHFKSLARLLDLRLEVYDLLQIEDVIPTVERVCASGIDVMIGGLKINALAEGCGMKTVPLYSGEESCRETLLQALKMSQAMSLEKERFQRFRVLVEYSAQGIIGMDRDGRINVFNEAAERILSRSAAEVLGRDMAAAFPELPVAAALAGKKAILGELVRIEQRRLIANVIPIEVGGDVAGAMTTIEDVREIVKLEATVRSALYARGLYAHFTFRDILGASPKMLEAKRIAAEYARTDSTILVTGESGTGKELFAQGIHNASRRREGPFVAVNCGAIPTSLLESELFGYEEGAFTGANRKGKPGLFEIAHNGTIFLDEIGEMDKQAQTSLLRVIQERRVMRLGGEKFLPVDVRIIAASNTNLADLIRQGKFREDLYYRINVLPLHLPPLRERGGDGLDIARRYVAECARLHGKNVKLTQAAIDFMIDYDWPGNIRQLRNYVERLVVTGQDDLVEVPIRNVPEPEEPAGTTRGQQVRENPPRSRETLAEKDRILDALAATCHNQKEAARALGIDRSTLYRKLKAYGIRVRKSCD